MPQTLSAASVIQGYFGTVRKVDLNEFKQLSKEERCELADGAAKEMGLTRTENDGKVEYVKS